MARSHSKNKGRKDGGRFTGIPHAVMLHPDYVALSSNAKVLLFEMAMQFNGFNNGDLCAAWSIMKARGFNSETTLNKVLSELIERGFLIRTREGRFMNPGKQCALYAVTWCAIDTCEGKRLEVKPTTAPIRAFSAEIIKMPSPETEATGSRKWSERAELKVIK